jgi:hypothetical protein
VHGAKPPTSERVAAAARDVTEAARLLLLLFLEQGWPSEDDLRELPLG